MIHRWKYAVAAGALCAAVELALLLAAEPGVSVWLLVQSALAWFACGVVVMLSESGLPPVGHAVAMTLLINAGWFIAESFAKGKPSHFLPMVLASAVLGAFIGLLRKKANNRRSSHAAALNLMLALGLIGIVACGSQCGGGYQHVTKADHWLLLRVVNQFVIASSHLAARQSSLVRIALDCFAPLAGDGSQIAFCSNR